MTFTEGDAKWLHWPHNDALVVTMAIGGVNMHRLLFDNGSSVNILAYSTFRRLGLLDKDRLLTNNELYDFTGNRVQIMGRVNLPLTLGAEPLVIPRYQNLWWLMKKYPIMQS